MIAADVLVIGGGAAGLRAAAEAAAQGAAVLLLTKGRIGRAGCSAFLDHRIEYSLMNIPDEPPDAPERYAEDTLACGAGRNDPAIVRAFVTGIFDERDLLGRLGLRFREEGGRPRRVHLPGHSYPRSVVTEEGFGRKLLARLADLCLSRGVTLREGMAALDLLAAGGRAAGATAADERTGERVTIHAGAVILAAGGLGAVFRLTTNPPDIGGDGAALAWRAGAALRDMECVQYHPLTTWPLRGTYLVSGVLLTGTVRNRLGQAFAFDPPAGLPPHAERKARLRALGDWMAGEAVAGRAGEDRAFAWDGTAIARATYDAQMPSTCAAFRRAGVDVEREPIRIAPGAHQMLGGLRVNADGAATIPGLFAAGEVMGGLHGADRLSGTGILEALVFGRRAGRAAAAFAAQAGRPAPGAAAPPPRAGVAARTARASVAEARALEARITEAMEPLLVRRDAVGARLALAVLEEIRAEADAIPDDPVRHRTFLRLDRVRNLAAASCLVARAVVEFPWPTLPERGGR